MILRALFLTLLSCGVAAGQTSRPATKPRGLTAAEATQVDALLAAEGLGALEPKLAALMRNPDPRSVMILTHTWLGLPWEPDLAPKHPRDMRMRRVLAGFVLDRKIADWKHQELLVACRGAARSAPQDPKQVVAATKALLDWTLANLKRLARVKSPGGVAIFALPLAKDATGPSKRYRGLSQAEEARLTTLLKTPADAQFDAWLNELVWPPRSKRVVLLVTHLMIELPWVPSLAPRRKYDYRMKKLRVERILDRLVSVQTHDQLSAGYFRAVTPHRGPSDPKKVSAARKALLDWTLDALPKLKRSKDGPSFHLPDEPGER